MNPDASAEQPPENPATQSNPPWHNLESFHASKTDVSASPGETDPQTAETQKEAVQTNATNDFEQLRVVSTDSIAAKRLETKDGENAKAVSGEAAGSQLPFIHGPSMELNDRSILRLEEAPDKPKKEVQPTSLQSAQNALPATSSTLVTLPSPAPAAEGEGLLDLPSSDSAPPSQLNKPRKSSSSADRKLPARRRFSLQPPKVSEVPTLHVQISPHMRGGATPNSNGPETSSPERAGPSVLGERQGSPALKAADALWRSIKKYQTSSAARLVKGESSSVSPDHETSSHSGLANAIEVTDRREKILKIARMLRYVIPALFTLFFCLFIARQAISPLLRSALDADIQETRVIAAVFEVERLMEKILTSIDAVRLGCLWLASETTVPNTLLSLQSAGTTVSVNSSTIPLPSWADLVTSLFAPLMGPVLSRQDEILSIVGEIFNEDTLVFSPSSQDSTFVSTYRFASTDHSFSISTSVFNSASSSNSSLLSCVSTLKRNASLSGLSLLSSSPSTCVPTANTQALMLSSAAHASWARSTMFSTLSSTSDKIVVGAPENYTLFMDSTSTLESGKGLSIPIFFRAKIGNPALFPSFASSSLSAFFRLDLSIYRFASSLSSYLSKRIETAQEEILSLFLLTSEGSVLVQCRAGTDTSTLVFKQGRQIWESSVPSPLSTEAEESKEVAMFANNLEFTDLMDSWKDLGSSAKDKRIVLPEQPSLSVFMQNMSSPVGLSLSPVFASFRSVSGSDLFIMIVAKTDVSQSRNITTSPFALIHFPTYLDAVNGLSIAEIIFLTFWFLLMIPIVGRLGALYYFSVKEIQVDAEANIINKQNKYLALARAERLISCCRPDARPASVALTWELAKPFVRGAQMRRVLQMESFMEMKRTVEAGNGYEITLEDVLAHPFALEVFKDFLVAKRAGELVQFCVEAQMYRTLGALSNSKDVRLYVALDLIQNYIIVGAPMQINISSRMRNDVLRKYQKSIIAGLFDEPEREVKKVMRHSLWIDFRKSKSYAAAAAVIAMEKKEKNQLLKYKHIKRMSISDLWEQELAPSSRPSALVPDDEKGANAGSAIGTSIQRQLKAKGRGMVRRMSSMVVTAITGVGAEGMNGRRGGPGSPSRTASRRPTKKRYSVAPLAEALEAASYTNDSSPKSSPSPPKKRASIAEAALQIRQEVQALQQMGKDPTIVVDD